jgi:FKBP-type peptidyl-prolyl cis-trans isomerase
MCSDYCVNFYKMEEFTMITNDRGVYKRILKEGVGNVPKSGDRVKVEMEGVLESGYKFIEKKQVKVNIDKNEITKGIDIALKTMKIGELAVFVMRYDYGFFDEEVEDIPPYSCLIFKLELLEVLKKIV